MMINNSLSQCFVNLPQNYLVCITIHKAKNLFTFNADTYVTINLNKKTKTTATIRNTDNPYYNEYFVFELNCTIQELLRHNVSIIIYQRKCCAKNDDILSKIQIDLSTVWHLPKQSFYKKWVNLELPIGVAQEENRSYLQLDISIISKDHHPAPAVISQTKDYDIIEEYN